MSVANLAESTRPESFSIEFDAGVAFIIPTMAKTTSFSAHCKDDMENVFGEVRVRDLKGVIRRRREGRYTEVRT